jgi:hypothetical protein
MSETLENKSAPYPKNSEAERAGSVPVDICRLQQNCEGTKRGKYGWMLTRWRRELSAKRKKGFHQGTDAPPALRGWESEAEKSPDPFLFL